MGQYFYIANLDKKEYLHPHRIGCGLKLWEIIANDGCKVLPFLLRKSSSSGGGDFYGYEDSEWAGRWAGDRLVVIGDYDSSELYQEISDSDEWVEIGSNEQLRDEFNQFMGGVTRIGDW